MFVYTSNILKTLRCKQSRQSSYIHWIASINATIDTYRLTLTSCGTGDITGLSICPAYARPWVQSPATLKETWYLSIPESLTVKWNWKYIFPTSLEEKRDLPENIKSDFFQVTPLVWKDQAIQKLTWKWFAWLISMGLIFLTLVFFQVIQIR